MSPEKRFKKEAGITEITSQNLELYIKWLEDNCKELSDYSDWEIVDYLEGEGFEFSEQVSDDEMIDHLADLGYIILEENPVTANNGLDYIDNRRLEEITEKFTKGSWVEKEEIYNKLIAL